MTIDTSEDLKAFILDPQRMRMSHVYKPLMVIAVLRNGGAASRNEIAAEFIGRDVFQLEHYRRNIVDRMPGTRLVRGIKPRVRAPDGRDVPPPAAARTHAATVQFGRARPQAGRPARADVVQQGARPCAERRVN